MAANLLAADHCLSSPIVVIFEDFTNTQFVDETTSRLRKYPPKTGIVPRN